jgi:hypothetical protein
MPPVRTPRGSARGRGRGAKGENPIITRSGRGSKPAKGGKSDVTPKSFPIQNNTNLTPARKATRSASNVSTYSSFDVYAEFDGGTLTIHGLKSTFLAGLAKRVKPVTPVKKRQPPYRPDPDLLPPLYSDDDLESSDESEVDLSSPPQPAPARGRGSGRARGGRGRGSRGRGAGRGRGRGRGGGGIGATSASAKDVSPLRNRPMRNAAPMFPLTEEDDDEPSNQASPVGYAKELNSPNEEMLVDEASTDGENEEQEQLQNNQQTNSNTPMDSPSLGSKPPPTDVSSKVMRSIPRISLPRKSGSQTPQDAAFMSATLPVRKLLNPEDDVLLDSDLPGPWIEGLDDPIRAECEDDADYQLQLRYKPMTDVQGIINSLTKYPVYQRSTENLYRLAENTQKILKAWQDEYLKLDARVSAPYTNIGSIMLIVLDRTACTPAKEACKRGPHSSCTTDLRRHERG